MEPRRHELFVLWLRTRPQDRMRYEAVKRRDDRLTGDDNDQQAVVVYEIYEAALAADPRHLHDPRPPGDTR